MDKTMDTYCLECGIATESGMQLCPACTNIDKNKVPVGFWNHLVDRGVLEDHHTRVSLACLQDEAQVAERENRDLRFRDAVRRLAEGNEVVWTDWKLKPDPDVDPPDSLSKPEDYYRGVF